VSACKLSAVKKEERMVDPNTLADIAKRHPLPAGVGWVALEANGDMLLIFEPTDTGWIFSLAQELPGGRRAQVGIMVHETCDPEHVPVAIDMALFELERLVRSPDAKAN
jgi:hypothetical protein